MRKQTENEKKLYNLVSKEPNTNFNAYLKVIRVNGVEWEAIRISNKIAKLGINQKPFYYDDEFEDYTIPVEI